MTRTENLQRITDALDAAVAALEPFASGAIAATTKRGGDPVTAADLAVNDVLLGMLLRPGEGWLSEETADSIDRLRCERVWIVDPIDGTREFVEGIPEWCVSIGLVENGRPVAGGVANPATGERIVGGTGVGVRYVGERSIASAKSLAEATVLASRSEVRRGEWNRFANGTFRSGADGFRGIQDGACRGGAGRCDMDTGAKARVGRSRRCCSRGGSRRMGSASRGREPLFNQRQPLLPGFGAASAGVARQVRFLLRASPVSET